MKKLLFLVVMGALTLQLSAQGVGEKVFNQPGNFYIIPKIGYNMANISKIKSDPRHAINVGVSAEYMITDMFSIDAGLYYSMQGASWRIDEENLSFLESIGNVKVTLKNDYINIPVLLKAYVADGFHLFAGPQLGYLVNSSVGGKVSILGFELGTTSVATIDEYIKEYEKDFDFSVVIGAGYQTKSGLLISASYNLGITKLLQMDLGSSSTNYLNFDARNNVLQVNLGYRF